MEEDAWDPLEDPEELEFEVFDETEG